jgi:hypothetical protein
MLIKGTTTNSVYYIAISGGGGGELWAFFIRYGARDEETGNVVPNIKSLSLNS